MPGKRRERRDYEKLNTLGKTSEDSEEEVVKTKEEQLELLSIEGNMFVEEECEPTEEDLADLEERLRNAQVSKEKMERKDKCRRLTKEAKELEEDVRKMKKKESRRKGAKVTTVSLRKMDDVVRKVDRVMDERLNNMSASSSSEEERSDGSSGEESLVSSSDEDSDEGRRNRKGKGKNGKKSKDEKHYHHTKKSGKSKKLTSLVKFPQEWPHSYLGLHFVDQDKTYDSLSMAEFCAGYTSILESIKDEKLRRYRMAHFRDLMYLATQYQWRCVLKFHAACLLEVERGNMRWGQTFQVLQNATLAGGFIHNQNSFGRFGGSGAFNNNSNNNTNYNNSNFHRGFNNNNNQSMRNGERVSFCSRYQNGSCNQQNDHNGFLNGETRFLRHICATCWLTNRRRAAHPANSDTCPSRTDQLLTADNP